MSDVLYCGYHVAESAKRIALLIFGKAAAYLSMAYYARGIADVGAIM